MYDITISVQFPEEITVKLVLQIIMALTMMVLFHPILKQIYRETIIERGGTSLELRLALAATRNFLAVIGWLTAEVAL